MAKYSDAQRMEACKEVLSGRTVASVAREVGVTAPYVRRWVRRYQNGEPFDQRKFNGRVPLLTDEDMRLVAGWVEDDPYKSASSICEALGARHERTVTATMLRTAMKKAGIRFVRPVRTAAEDSPPEQQTRYQPEHRREREGERYPSSLTDAEWEIVRPIFEEAATGRGRPFTTDPRETLDAIFYVLRSGCSWRMLPAHFPNWKSIYTNFRAWTLNGRMDKVYDALLEMWRGRAGRSPQPTAVIIDSQTVKTTEKGGLEDTMVPRRSMEGSGTSP